MARITSWHGATPLPPQGFDARPENYVVTDSGALDFMMSEFHRFSKNESFKVIHCTQSAWSSNFQNSIGLTPPGSHVRLRRPP